MAKTKLKLIKIASPPHLGAAILMWNEVIFVGEGFYNLLISSFITEQCSFPNESSDWERLREDSMVACVKMKGRLKRKIK